LNLEELRISVAMCTYNGARFLSEQLESIAGQTRLPDELIICDDLSSDESLEIIRTFARRAPFVVRAEINEKNLGSTKNFEKAMSLCREGVIALADQDDVWKPQKLGVIQKTLDEHPEAGYVFSDAEMLDERGVPTGRSLWESLGLRESFPGDFTSSRQFDVLLRRTVVTGATMALRSSLKSVILPFSPYLVHDYWSSLLASCVGVYGVPISERLIQYRQHASQQVGIGGSRSLLKKVRWAHQGAVAQNRRNALGLQDVRDRLLLATADGRTCSPDRMRSVEDKLEHCSRRVAAHAAHGVARIRSVFAETLTGRYGRFSNSWQSILEDLCL
jgi:glycosyltransferase involved in cell wall biosynthesis